MTHPTQEQAAALLAEVEGSEDEKARLAPLLSQVPASVLDSARESRRARRWGTSTSDAEFLHRVVQRYLDERGEDRAPTCDERPAPVIPLYESQIERAPSAPVTSDTASSSVTPGAPINTADAASFLKCSTRTVKERARLGEIPHRKVPGCRALVFFQSELIEWLNGVPLEVQHLPGDGRTVRPKKAAA